MKLDISRTLNNRVFSTTLIRTIKDDNDYVKERVYEDDFGAIEIDAGGKFELLIYLDNTTGNLMLEKYDPEADISDLDCVVHKFIKDSNNIKVEVGTEISYSKDAKQINALELSKSKTKVLTDMIAEFECRIFEIIIADKIRAEIDKWCKYTTTFETEQVEPIIIKAPCTGGE